jgi:hypothetical protein
MQMQQLPRYGSRYVLYRRAPWNAPRPLFCGRGRAARWLLLFRNQRDARVRVLRNSPTFYFRIRVESMGKDAVLLLESVARKIRRHKGEFSNLEFQVIRLESVYI